jgi:outer membrane autotransporter protein
MNGSTQVVGTVATANGSTGSRRPKTIKVAPVTRAVRAALAVSTAAFALAGSGAAFAGDCTAPVASVVHCNGDFTDTINFAVEDLTLVVGDEAPSTITPADGSPGILADWAGAIGVTNFADITTYAADGIHAVGSGDIALENNGAIDAEAFGQSIGIYAYSDGGDVTIANGGAVSAYSYAGLADAIFASGINVDVSNSADGTLDANGFDWAAGIEAQGSDSVVVSNAGNIGVQTYGVGEAFGIYAGGGAGGAAVDNSGLVQVRGYDAATGIYASAGGDIDISNSGYVLAGYVDVVDGNTYSSSYATGILAMSGTDGAAITIDNSGVAYAASFSGSSGIEARSLGVGGSVDISNGGDVYAFALAYGASAAGIAASADGDANIDSAGMLYAYSAGTAYGAIALSFNGDASVSNSGDIEAVNSAFLYYGAYGVVAASQNGAASADNSGNIAVHTGYIGAGIDASGMAGATAGNSGDIAIDAWVAYGMRAVSSQGDVFADNSGTITAAYSGSFPGYAFGILGNTTLGDVALDNSGSIDVFAGQQSVGLFATTTGGDASVTNSGDIHGGSYYTAGIGMFVRAGAGTASIDNSGSVTGYSVYGDAYGALARGMYVEASNSGDISAVGYSSAHGVYLDSFGDASLSSSGSIEAVAVGNAYGAFVYSYTGDAGIDNSGGISAQATYGLAAGAVAIGYYGATVSNSGDISAEAGEYGSAIGVFAQAYGDVLVQNSGTISATQQDVAIAVSLESLYGTATLENSGTITTDTSVAGSIAVLGSNGANEIANTGEIHGAIVTFAGDDLFANGSGGNWLVGNGTTDFGGGDDTIQNGAGGTIHLANGGIYLGSSGAAGNSFENQGTIRASGYGLIDMGTGPMALVPSLNPLAFVNDGIIDFVDGAPDDMLVIVGDLGGDGAINLDVSLLNGTSDLLYVDGSVVDGTTQAINLSIDGMPGALQGDMAPVVAVSGNIAANSFVGGEVLNFDPSNFLDLGVAVATTSAGGLNVVSTAITVDGLNDTGVLAASIASGAHSLINSSIGTLRQRMGVTPQAVDGQAGLSPWIRVFTDKGDVDPHASGFGSGGDFGFEQENRGREFGMDFGFGNGFSLGLMAGTADGTQRLTGAEGSDRLKLHSSGLHATWMGPSVYVDASVRWMDFDARLLSAAGEQDTSGNATAFNLEAGYTGWTMAGMNVVPQVQYTRSQIDNIDVVQGSQAGFAAGGGASERGRLGVAIDRSFATAGGMTWTPYGALSAVREFDGESTFVIADAFEGGTDIEGTSALVELGVGAQKGGFSATAGVNWTDGGALDSFVGGQLSLRYTW